ncbi:SAM-dependent methyltransferase [Ornithobacterium rhinotracheale]|uniref:tRNA (5-methylaminomethyl-2-thiouridine)(34)-methyltransferase MnmD n=1 Tax=Ornithobacterium rhinotracheale TaxID=28251 RepID=UPI00129C2182|nr:tRNA (5-methylaminomethyl-2-thiouridine)(34)-methyltransferase MnmD [Ornithobacterium rhinotracheale]MRI62998.1 SAM-dependent methyltransferase [Ornithobacterium rhinotracheale]
MLKREILTTADGSKTLYLPDWNEHYHSKHGALQEAQHVFIANGLAQFSEQDCSILEFGFGTGLNALLTLLSTRPAVRYHSLEKYPLSLAEVQGLDYPKRFADFLGKEERTIKPIFEQLHHTAWGEYQPITPDFSLKKEQADFIEVALPEEAYHLVYFDAFGKRVQPELWQEEVFDKIYKALKKSGLFTTYACNGDTKRALKAVGFSVEKKPGPPGKREMINAWKD